GARRGSEGSRAIHRRGGASHQAGEEALLRSLGESLTAHPASHDLLKPASLTECNALGANPLHSRPLTSCFRAGFSTLPTGFRGNSSKRRMRFGTLYAAMCCFARSRSEASSIWVSSGTRQDARHGDLAPRLVGDPDDSHV